MAYRLEIKGNYWVAEDSVTGDEKARVPAEDLEFRTRGDRFYFHTTGNQQRLIQDIGILFSELQDPTGTTFATKDACSTWLENNTGAGAGGGGTTPATVAKTSDITTQTTALEAKIDALIASDNTLTTTQTDKLEELKTADATQRAQIVTELTEQGISLDSMTTTLTALGAAEIRKAQAEADALVAQNNTTAEITKAVDELQKIQDVTIPVKYTGINLTRDASDRVSTLAYTTPTGTVTITIGRDANGLVQSITPS